MPMMNRLSHWFALEQRVATIALGGKVDNTQYDPVSHHVFVNVRTRQQLIEIDPIEGNDRMLVLDLRTKRVSQSFDISADPHVLAFDSSSHTVYVAGEQGVTSMYEAEAKGVRHPADGHVGPNAHVACIDAKTHYSYFPLKSVYGRPLLRILAPH